MKSHCGSGGCCSGHDRNFLTREEKIDMLKEHKASLENEAKGISERIDELGKSK